MTAKNIWIILGAIIILVIGYAFYSFNVDTKKEAEWNGLQGKAKFDPYYITERFLKAKGLTVRRETTYTSINQYSDFNQYDTIFFSNKGETLSQSQIPVLLDWVESGGKIVINANKNFSRDKRKYTNDKENKKSLLQTAGIAVSKCRLDKFGKKYCPNYCEKTEEAIKANDEDSNSNNSSETGMSDPAVKSQNVAVNTVGQKTTDDKSLIEKKLDEKLKISVPENDDTNVTFTADGQIINRGWRRNIKEIFADQGKAKQLWNQPARCSGSLFADFAYGTGHIVVYQEYSDRFKTDRYEFSHDILKDHNATHLYYLLNLETKANSVLWFERDNYTTAWTIIWRYGFYALLSALLLLIAWAWRNGKRFGPLIVTDERETLSLKRHLNAMGDFHLKNNCRHTLVASCYEQLDSAITKVIPIAATLSKDDLAETIKEKTLLPLAHIRIVLERKYPEDDAEFTQLIHTINEIRKRL